VTSERPARGTWALVVAISAVFAVAGCAPDASTSGPVITTASSAPVFVEFDAAGDRVALPPIPGLTLDARPMVINAWASWCEPCRVEAPELAAFTVENPDIRMVGINVNDEPGAAQAFAAATGMTYEQVTDANGTVLASIPGIPPTGLPSTIVVDDQGRIAARIIGPVNGQLQSVVDQALGKG
jgi:thiol-disulfide isomerase/thioredoxin